jgi:hypothetical protein
MDSTSQFGLLLPGSEGESGTAPHKGVLGEVSEAGSVSLSRRSKAQDAVVAGKFAFDAEATLDPVEGRVEGEEDEADLLEEIGPVVPTTEMLHLVEKDMFELLRRELFEQGWRKQNARVEERDDAGAVYISRDAELG